MAFNCATLDDFLEVYGEELGKEADKAMAPLHVPSRDGVDHLVPMGLELFPGQSHVVAASVKVLHRQDYVNVVAEMGSGKGPMAIGVAHNHACSPKEQRWHLKNPSDGASQLAVTNRSPNYRVLVMCPGHLPKKWEREILRMLPHAKVRVVETYKEVVNLDPSKPPEGPEWWVIGKDRAKLSCGWEGATIPRRDHGSREYKWRGCPDCGLIQKDKDGHPHPASYFDKNRRKCECGAQLWQDIAKPRRFSPALFIKKKLKGFFDYYIMDEVQDGRSQDSIQADAMGFLAAACKKTITLTGTLVGGKATDVRTTLFRVGAAESLVTMGLGWHDETAFVEKYGRIETKIVSRGESDGEGHRMAKGGKKKGRNVTKTVKPGIMPTLFGEHLVSACVFLSLDEVCADLPEFREDVVPVPMRPDHNAEYKRIEDSLRQAIKALMFKGGARKILGKMLQALLAYPDFPFDWEEIGYHEKDPNSMDGDRMLWIPIVQPANMPKDVVYPKEEALIAQVLRERREGRKCWVYTNLVEKRDSIGRLERLLNEAGVKAIALRSYAVAPMDREAWVEKNGPKYDVILSHPDLVKTGLDFFSKDAKFNFPTIIFAATGYCVFTLSQASRRAWRIGQKKECRVIYMYYESSMQETAMTLMGKKMAACSAVSGRFSMEGLAALAGEDDGLEMAMAKSLVENTTGEGEALRAWAKITTPISYQTFDEKVEEIDLLDLLDDLPFFNEVPV